jgi:hypothetical protein
MWGLLWGKIRANVGSISGHETTKFTRFGRSETTLGVEPGAISKRFEYRRADSTQLGSWEKYEPNGEENG